MRKRFALRSSRWLQNNQAAAFTISAFYLIGGAIWIFLSDRALQAVVTDPERLTRYQTYKGWGFVLVGTFVLFWVTRSILWLRRREARKQEETRRFLSTLLTQLPGMVYRCENSRDWTMKFVSDGAQSLTGYSPAELLDDRTVSYAGLIDPEDRDRVWNEVQSAVEKRLPFQIEYRIRTKNGERKWVWEQGCGIFSNDRLEALEGFITDISPRKLAEEKVHGQRDALNILYKKTQQQVGQLQALREIDLAITGSHDLGLTTRVVLESVVSQLGVDAANILVLDKHSQKLRCIANRGFRSDTLRHTHLSVGHGLAGRAARSRETIYVQDLSTARGEFPDSVLTVEAFVSYWAVPLLAKGEVKGVLEVFHRQRLVPAQEWRDFLETLAGQAAIAIDNATLFEELNESNVDLRMAYDETIEGWSRALDLRDRETEGHTQRVAKVTVRLAQAMGLRERDLVHVHRGALLHDIGKMGVPDSILLKPGPLTGDEWRIMRLHPVYAHQLLSPISFLRPALDIPYCHHERWDGSGYPRGLVGRSIPLAARIFSVVDVWDALRSDRPYREGRPEAEVREYLLRQSGKEFDPEVVDAFLSLPPGATDTTRESRGRSDTVLAGAGSNGYP